MTPQLMVQPSTLMHSGIQVVQVGSFQLFRFTDELQVRSDELIERHKAGLLIADEAAELAGISDLSRIFTFINAQLAATAKWVPSNIDDWYANEPNISANTATPPNI
jgi:hypothetical protein